MRLKFFDKILGASGVAFLILTYVTKYNCFYCRFNNYCFNVDHLFYSAKKAI